MDAVLAVRTKSFEKKRLTGIAKAVRKSLAERSRDALLAAGGIS